MIFRAHTSTNTATRETLPPATAMQRNPRHNKPKPTCGAAHRCHLCPPPVSELEASLMILLCRRHRLEDAVGKSGICRHGRQGIRCCLRGSRHHRGDGGAESERDEGSLEHHRCLHNTGSGPLSESNGRRAKLCRCSLHLTRTLTRGFLRAPCQRCELQRCNRTAPWRTTSQSCEILSHRQRRRLSPFHI